MTGQLNRRPGEGRDPRSRSEFLVKIASRARPNWRLPNNVQVDPGFRRDDLLFKT